MGQLERSAPFNGTDDYIDISDIVPTITNDVFGTIAIRIKPTHASDEYGQIITFGDTNADEYLNIRFAANELDIMIRDANIDAWRCTTTGSLFTSNTWYNIVLVHNGTTPIVYLNNVDVTNFSISTDKTKWFSSLAGLDNAFIGKLSKGSSPNIQPFEGDAAGLRIYNRALSSAERTLLNESYRV